MAYGCNGPLSLTAVRARRIVPILNFAARGKYGPAERASQLSYQNMRPTGKSRPSPSGNARTDSYPR